jgi:iron complex outermembrane recepter protein
VSRCSNFCRLLLQLVALCFALSSQVNAQNASVTIHIPAKPLAEALVDFAVQARLSISDTGIDFDKAVSNPVDGTFSREDALRRLLAGSGFAFEFVDSSTVRIRLPQRPPHPFERYRAPIERIVVTATKRQELAQTVPYSIVVTTGQQLESLGMRSAYDLTTQVAGLTATNLGPGEDKLFVRGLTDSVLPGLSESIVGIYLDEARITDDASDPGLRLIDVERVEVLRGPQGSLYGAGSLTGLVRIVTRKPVFDTLQSMAGAAVSVTELGGVSATADAMLNLPLISDELALRVVGYTDDIAGYVDDTRLHESNTNHTRVMGGRAALGWQPDGLWTIIFNLTLQNIEAADSQYYLSSLGPQNRDNFLREPHSDKFLQTGVTASATLGWADIVSSTSFLDRQLRNRFDASRAWTDLTGFPLGASPFDYARTIRSLTHETRLTSIDGNRWKWLAGVFLSYRDEDFASSLTGPDATGVSVLARMETREDLAKEAALFGEVTYEVTPELSLTAGARVFHVSRDVTAHASGFLVETPTPFIGTNKQAGVAPKWVLAYQPTPDVKFYAQFSQGYRVGGLNVDGPAGATGDTTDTAFDADILRNYELGSKTSFFDGRVVANAAVYYAIWKNVQTDQIAPDGAFFIENAGTVRDLGFELDLALRPLRNLSVQGNVFWNNAKLSEQSPIATGPEGNLPGAPDVSFGMSARYDIPLDPEDDAFMSLDYGYVGSSHLGFNENTPQMGGYHRANIRIGLARDAWQAVLFVDNLTDDEQNTFAFGNPFNGKELQVTPPRPRTIGLALVWAD